jgi:hypothetical protein
MKQEESMLVLSELDIFQFEIDIQEVCDIPENPISLNSINLL